MSWYKKSQNNEATKEELSIVISGIIYNIAKPYKQKLKAAVDFNERLAIIDACIRKIRTGLIKFAQDHGYEWSYDNLMYITHTQGFWYGDKSTDFNYLRNGIKRELDYLIV
jgi:shikimate 5-dehydrogenase